MDENFERNTYNEDRPISTAYLFNIQYLGVRIFMNNSMIMRPLRIPGNLKVFHYHKRTLEMCKDLIKIRTWDKKILLKMDQKRINKFRALMTNQWGRKINITV